MQHLFDNEDVEAITVWAQSVVICVLSLVANIWILF